MSSAGLAVVSTWYLIGAKGHRSQVDPNERSKLSMLNGSALSTELIKIKGDVRDPRGRNTLCQRPLSGYFGSIFLY